MLNSVFLTVQAEELSQEVADANGFTIYTNTETGETYYLDNRGRVPNQIYVYTENEMDISKYLSGASTDFYGVEIIKIEYIGPFVVESGNDWIVENPPIWHEYLLYTKNFYTLAEASKTELFKDVAIIKSATLRYGRVVGDNTPITPIMGDVNENGRIEARDYLLLKRAFFGTYKLTEQGKLNGDVNFNGRIDARDYLLLKRAFFGTYTIGTPDTNATDDKE